MGSEPSRVTLAFRRSRAPRAPTAGAFRVGCLALEIALSAVATPRAASTQQVPDTVQVVDSVQAQDSLPAPADAAPPVVSDSLQQVLDSLAAVVDSLSGLVVDTFPRFPSGVAPSFETAVWSWDRTAMGATRALTVAELVSQVPGVIPLKGGDYGTPQAAIGFGVGGGRVRVLWDGFEWLPLDGGIADLSRIGLGGIEEVRVERQSGELLIEIRSMEPNDREPVTMVDVGTGDLGTNVLRGVLAHPRTLGGALTFTLDRLETRGPGLDAAGSLSGVGLRYALARGNRGGLSAEVRRFATKTDVEDFPSNVTRSDWNLRGRWRFTDDLVGEAVWGASSLKGDADDSIFGDVDARRSQLGLRAGYERGGIWGDASARFLEGDGLPTGSFGLAMGASHPKALSLDASLRSQRWSEEDAKSWRARAVTAPLFGLSLFASYEDGRSGAPFVPQFEAYLRSLEPPPVDTLAVDPDPEPQDSVQPLDRPVTFFTERTGIRAGATFRWRSLSLSGAWLSMEADSIRPLGTLLDRDGVTVAGGKRTGYEVSASLPLPITGFRLEGALQSWNDELPYLPLKTWDGAITYHSVFKESRNLELWGTIGVTGHEAMLLPIIDPDPPVDEPVDPLEEEPDPDAEPPGPPLLRMPIYRDVFGHIQVRIVTVRIFIRWENVAAKDDNFDFPGREQPRFRTIYGVRWTMNN